jgi:hypothetical protein
MPHVGLVGDAISLDARTSYDDIPMAHAIV